MRRTAILLALSASFAAAGVGIAQTTGTISARLTPDGEGRASSLRVVVTGASAAGAALPESIVLAVQRGFRFDTRAVARRCAPRQAAAVACPSASAIGKGTARLSVSGVLVPGGSQTFVAQLRGFLAAPVGRDVAGLVLQLDEPETKTHRAVRGRLVARSSGRYGYEVRFENFASASPVLPAGISIALDKLTLGLGAQRQVTVKGRKRTLTLIRNPRRCTGGAWSGRLTIRAAGTDDRRAVSVPCR